MSNVRPTEARKAKRTTLDKIRIINIHIPSIKILALEKNIQFNIFRINILPLIPSKNPIVQCIRFYLQNKTFFL